MAGLHDAAGLAALASVVFGLVLLRPVCIAGCALLRELNGKRPGLVCQSYKGRCWLVSLLLMFLPMAGLHFGLTLAGGAATVFVLFALVLGWIDAETGYLPDSLTLPLLWMGVLINIPATFVDLEQAVLGASFGYGVLWLLNTLFVILRKKPGMGHGDFKLLAAFGAWLGLTALPTILLLSSLSSLVFALVCMFMGRWRAGSYLHFGPYLVGGALVYLFVWLS